jgi:predicted  nucleic acid-binding Zn-ribbon protein
VADAPLWNPYQYGPRVEGTSPVYVRRQPDEEIPRIVDAFSAHARGQTSENLRFRGYWLAAPARSGKSSWLQSLRREMKAAGATLWEGIVDLESGFRLQPSHRDRTAISLPREDIEPDAARWLAQDGEPAMAREKARETAGALLRGLGRGDALLIDEAQALARGGRFGGTALAIGDRLRDAEGPLVVCVGQRKPELLNRNEVQGLSEQFGNSFIRRELAHFSLELVRKLVDVGFGRVEGAPPGPDLNKLASQVFAMCGGYPELTQTLLGDLWDYLQSFPSTPADDVGKVLDELGQRRVAESSSPVFARFAEFLKRTPEGERVLALTLWGRLLDLEARRSAGDSGGTAATSLDGTSGGEKGGEIFVEAGDDPGAQQLHASGVAQRRDRGERRFALRATGALFLQRFSRVWLQVQIAENQRPLSGYLFRWVRLNRPPWEGDPGPLLQEIKFTEEQNPNWVWGELERSFITTLREADARLIAKRQEDLLREVEQQTRWALRGSWTSFGLAMAALSGMLIFIYSTQDSLESLQDQSTVAITSAKSASDAAQNVKNRLSDLNTQVLALRQDIGDVRSLAASTEGQVEEASTKLDDLTQQLSEKDSQLSALSEAAFQTIESLLAAKTNIEQLESSIRALQNQRSVLIESQSALSSSLRDFKANQVAISTKQAELNEKYELLAKAQSELTVAVQNAEQLKKTITDNITALNDREKTAQNTASALLRKLSDAEESLESNASVLEAQLGVVLRQTIIDEANLLIDIAHVYTNLPEDWPPQRPFARFNYDQVFAGLNDYGMKHQTDDGRLGDNHVNCSYYLELYSEAWATAVGCGGNYGVDGTPGCQLPCDQPGGKCTDEEIIKPLFSPTERFGTTQNWYPLDSYTFWDIRPSQAVIALLVNMQDDRNKFTPDQTSNFITPTPPPEPNARRSSDYSHLKTFRKPGPIQFTYNAPYDLAKEPLRSRITDHMNATACLRDLKFVSGSYWTKSIMVLTRRLR